MGFFNAKLHRQDLEYIRSDKWRCPNPETGAHHFIERDGILYCKYCPATRDRAPMPARMKKRGGRENDDRA